MPKRLKIPLYHTSHATGWGGNKCPLTDEQLEEWFDKVKHLPWNPQREWDYQTSINHIGHWMGRVAPKFIKDLRKGG